MARKTELFLLLFFGLLSCGHEADDPVAVRSEGITPYHQLNQGEDVSLEHHTSLSQLTFVGGSWTLAGREATQMDMPIYPRFIKTTDGRYLMFFHAGTAESWAGTYCAYAESADLVNWRYCKQIFPIQRNVQGHYDNVITRYYAGVHPLRLADGRMMAVASYRGSDDMRHKLLDNGLAIKFSSDEGASWSQEMRINVGTNWEPRPLLLPTGRIVIYYTDSRPYVEKVWNSAIISSGVSYIYSDDNGKTWLPEDALNDHPGAFRQLRDSKNGQNVYTDQMPGVICLKGSSLLVGTGESNMAPCSSSVTNYHVSLAYSGPNYDWGSPETDGSLPADRVNAAFKGAAPTIEQFPSGEVVLTYNNNNIFYMRTADDRARNFSDEVRFFGTEGIMGKGFWGSVLPDGHVLVAGVGGSGGASGLGYSLQIGQYYLNHDIYAAAHPVKVDGNNAEWPSSGQALFVGSRDKMHATLRASVKESRLYFLAEVENPSWSHGGSEAYVSVYLTSSGAGSLAEGDICLKIAFDGTVRVSKWQNGWRNASAEVPCCIQDGSGWSLAEFSIPLSACPSAASGAFKINFGIGDSISLQSVRPIETSTEKWLSLYIKEL